MEPKPHPTVQRDLGPPRVLVVDDELSIRYTIGELLSIAGIASLSADGVEQCLETLRQGFRGLIIMDVMMPGKNGWDTIREIRDNGLLEGNLIIMLTAVDVPDERMDGLQEVILDYLVKPFHAKKLTATVRKYLDYLDQTRTSVGA